MHCVKRIQIGPVVLEERVFKALSIAVLYCHYLEICFHHFTSPTFNATRHATYMQMSIVYSDANTFERCTQQISVCRNFFSFDFQFWFKVVNLKAASLFWYHPLLPFIWTTLNWYYPKCNPEVLEKNIFKCYLGILNICLLPPFFRQIFISVS